MPKARRIPDSEWEIMEGVWSLGCPASVRDVLEKLYPDGEKAYTTVQTMMNTLVGKKLLTRRKTGMVYFYEPTVSRADAVRSEGRILATRIFGGSFGALAAFLVDSGELTRGELQELKELIEAKEREQKASKGGKP